MSGKIGIIDDNTQSPSPAECFLLLKFVRTLNVVGFEHEFQFRVRSLMDELDVDSYATDQSSSIQLTGNDASLSSLRREGR